MADQEADDRLSPDEVFEILSNSRRRHLIYYLHDRAGTATLSEIADHIAAREYDTPVDRLDTDERRRVYISLYQTHLPKLVEHGVVEYHDDEKAVSLTGRVDAIDRYLYPDDRSDPWWPRYAALAAAAVVVLLGSWLPVYPLSLLRPEVAALLVAGAFIVLSAGHYIAVHD